LKLTFYDKLLIVSIVIAAIGLLAFNIQHEDVMGQKYVRIYVENELVKEISIDEQMVDEVTIPFGDEHEHEAVLEIKNGRVRMLPMSEDLCPKGICSHTGWISKSYESIVCVPNRILVEFDEREEDELDGVTY